MAKKVKKYQEAASKVDRTQHYSVEEAIKLAKETSISLTLTLLLKLHSV